MDLSKLKECVKKYTPTELNPIALHITVLDIMIRTNVIRMRNQGYTDEQIEKHVESIIAKLYPDNEES